MDVELFVCGTPAGESFWGKEEERNYFGNFYNGSREKPKMLVEARRQPGGKTYCYYSYIVYDGVVASDGRAGSYFCISLRTDCYCREYGNMYSLLDGIFRERIVGHFLKKTQGGTLKYEIANFDSVSAEIKGIFEEVMRRMKGLFSAESFTGLDGFAKQSNAVAKVNLYDCTEETILGYVKKYGAVELSPYFLTEKELAVKRECEAKVKAANMGFEKERREMNNAIAVERNNMAKLKGDMTARDVEIERLKGEVQRLNGDMKRMGSEKRMDDITKEVRELMKELQTAMKNLQSQTKSGWSRIVGKIVEVLRHILPTLNFIAVALLLFLTLSGGWPKSRSEGRRAVDGEVWGGDGADVTDRGTSDREGRRENKIGAFDGGSEAGKEKEHPAEKSEAGKGRMHPTGKNRIEGRRAVDGKVWMGDGADATDRGTSDGEGRRENKIGAFDGGSEAGKEEEHPAEKSVDVTEQAQQTEKSVEETEQGHPAEKSEEGVEQSHLAEKSVDVTEQAQQAEEGVEETEQEQQTEKSEEGVEQSHPTEKSVDVTEQAQQAEEGVEETEQEQQTEEQQ